MLDHEFFPVEALGLEPEPALARAIASVQPLRDDVLELDLAGVPMKRLTVPDLMIAVPDGIGRSLEKRGHVALFGVTFPRERFSGLNWLGIGFIAGGAVLVAYRG
jgi:hypothetical protein